jgi:hypothetical protein
MSSNCWAGGWARYSCVAESGGPDGEGQREPLLSEPATLLERPIPPQQEFFWFQLGRAPVEARPSHDHLRVQHLHLNRPRWWSDFGRKYTANARVNPMVNSVT